MNNHIPKGPIIKEGFPLIGAMLVLTILAIALGYYYVAVIPFVLALFFANFFRNPKRIIPEGDDLILSPADGKIMDISNVYEDTFLHKECKKVTIFLSVFDVHANRAPIDGKITFRQYTCGGFLPAFKDEGGFENERHTICIENERTSVVVTQIAGLLAGMIKFGSCTEIYMDPNVEIFVEKGQHVTAGDVVIGRLPNE